MPIVEVRNSPEDISQELSFTPEQIQRFKERRRKTLAEIEAMVVPESDKGWDVAKLIREGRERR